RRRQRAVAERRVHRVDVVQVEELRRLLEIRLADVGERPLSDALQRAIEQLAAVGHVLLALLALEPLPDLLARARSTDHRDPVPRRATAGSAPDALDDVP